jgi:hypothetical protein
MHTRLTALQKLATFAKNFKFGVASQFFKLGRHPNQWIRLLARVSEHNASIESRHLLNEIVCRHVTRQKTELRHRDFSTLLGLGTSFASIGKGFLGNDSGFSGIFRNQKAAFDQEIAQLDNFLRAEKADGAFIGLHLCK